MSNCFIKPLVLAQIRDNFYTLAFHRASSNWTGWTVVQWRLSWLENPKKRHFFMPLMPPQAALPGSSRFWLRWYDSIRGQKFSCGRVV